MYPASPEGGVLTLLSKIVPGARRLKSAAAPYGAEHAGLNLVLCATRARRHLKDVDGSQARKLVQARVARRPQNKLRA